MWEPTQAVMFAVIITLIVFFAIYAASYLFLTYASKAISSLRKRIRDEHE